MEYFPSETEITFAHESTVEGILAMIDHHLEERFMPGASWWTETYSPGVNARFNALHSKSADGTPYSMSVEQIPFSSKHNNPTQVGRIVVEDIESRDTYEYNLLNHNGIVHVEKRPLCFLEEHDRTSGPYPIGEDEAQELLDILSRARPYGYKRSKQCMQWLGQAIQRLK